VRLRTAALHAREEELRRAHAELRQAHAELEQAHAELEQRVQSRTAELRDANEQLRVSEAEKALLLNSTADLVTFIDPEMRIQWGNHEAATLARTTLDGLKGRHCFEAFHGRSAPCPGCPVLLANATGEPQSAELSRPGGRTIFHRAYPAKDEQGRVLGVGAFVLDISARKRMEEALRETNEWLDLTIEATGAGTFHTVTYGGPATVSPRFREMFALVDDAALVDFEAFLRTVHPDDRDRLREAVARSVDPSGGGVFEAEHRCVRHDGSVRWIAARGKAQFAEVEGVRRAVRFAVVTLDVTDRKREEQALRESEARGRAILASLAEGVVLHDAEGRVTTWNEAAEKLLGVSREEIAGRTVFDGPPPGSMLRRDGSPLLPEEHPVTLALRTGRRQSDVEIGMRRRDGELVWISKHAQPVRLPDGELIGVVASFFDITQRRQALQRSEEHLRTMADNVPDAIVRFDRERRILFANQAVTAGLGVPLERLVGKTREDLGRASERAASFDQQLLEVFRTGSPNEFEHLYEPGDHHCEVRLVPERGALGEIESVLSITRDITERKRAEQQLLASREQLRALVARLNSVREEEKAHLSRELHDEMGQLLTALKMELEVLEDGLGDPGMPGTVRELLERAVAASELVAKAIQSMRNLLASLRPVALDRLGLDSALRQECRRFQEWSGIACELATPYGLSTFGAEVDTALFRIAQEALTNVARHAGASRVAVALERRMGVAVLSVEDDGCGIPAGRESAGLGLLGMRERTERLGGVLAVKPAPGGGTIVEARIPLFPATSRTDDS
jgi:PAS domain S-box-containing protein